MVFKFRNPSAGSLGAVESGSLDRMKAAAERRKKGLDDSVTTVSGRVEETRVNPNSFIDELLKNTKLDQLEESAESMYPKLFNERSFWIEFIFLFYFKLATGLQLFIARDGTASLGSHEVKSGAVFKQVVMDNPR